MISLRFRVRLTVVVSFSLKVRFMVQLSISVRFGSD